MLVFSPVDTTRACSNPGVVLSVSYSPEIKTVNWVQKSKNNSIPPVVTGHIEESGLKQQKNL